MNRAAVYAHWTPNVLGLLKLQRAICGVPMAPTFGNRILLCVLRVTFCRERLGVKTTPSMIHTPRFRANHLYHLTGNHDAMMVTDALKSNKPERCKAEIFNHTLLQASNELRVDQITVSRNWLT